MLVLTRKLQQQIKIGEQITVTILRVKGNTVRVGIQAPREVRVVRGELPKNGDAGQAAVVAEAETVSVSDDAGEPAESSDESVAPKATSAAGPPALTSCAAHLPLRRIHNRCGSAPLKQIVASCAMLAK